MDLSFWELDVNYEKGVVAFSPPGKVKEECIQSELFFQTVTLGEKNQTKTENQTCEELKEKNRMSELKPTNLRKVRRLNLSSRAYLVYKIYPNEIPCNGPSDYASKNEEEECLRNRFFW